MADSEARTGYSKLQHASMAGSYGKREALPKGTLENELLDSAMGDCKGLTVLDVGGGQGVRARQVIDHGAIAVDVLDCEQICSDLMPLEIRVSF